MVSVFLFGLPISKAFNKNEAFKDISTLHLIEAKNNSEENIYIQGIKLNGKKVKKPVIPFEEIVNGGKIEFEMGPKPGKW